MYCEQNLFYTPYKQSTIIINHLSFVINHVSAVINHSPVVINHLSDVINRLTIVINHLSAHINHLTFVINHSSAMINHMSAIKNSYFGINKHVSICIIFNFKATSTTTNQQKNQIKSNSFAVLKARSMSAWAENCQLFKKSEKWFISFLWFFYNWQVREGNSSRLDFLFLLHQGKRKRTLLRTHLNNSVPS